MGYLHIENLYNNLDIMMFKEAYALEKVDGRSASILYNNGKVTFFTGGIGEPLFSGLFNLEALSRVFNTGFASKNVVLYGEAYGGKYSPGYTSYKKTLGFVGFDVCIDEVWLDVPDAHEVFASFGLDFVDYVKITTELEAIEAQKNRPSVLAEKNGMGSDVWREGVVLRPLIELVKKNGRRIISKHKRSEVRETKTERVVSTEELQVLSDAAEIANEWVTEMRMQHVLDKLVYEGPLSMKVTSKLIPAMLEDIKREGEKEIVWTKEAAAAITNATVRLLKSSLTTNVTPT